MNEFIYAAALAVVMLAPVALWIAHRIREEFAERSAHVCWIDDTTCRACDAHADRDLFDILYTLKGGKR